MRELNSPYYPGTAATSGFRDENLPAGSRALAAGTRDTDR